MTVKLTVEPSIDPEIQRFVDDMGELIMHLDCHPRTLETIKAGLRTLIQQALVQHIRRRRAALDVNTKARGA